MHFSIGWQPSFKSPMCDEVRRVWVSCSIRSPKLHEVSYFVLDFSSSVLYEWADKYVHFCSPRKCLIFICIYSASYFENHFHCLCRITVIYTDNGCQQLLLSLMIICSLKPSSFSCFMLDVLVENVPTQGLDLFTNVRLNIWCISVIWVTSC